jgi:putative intracellular protease/amidase
MKSRLILWSGLGALGLFGTMGGAWILSLPQPLANTTAPPIAQAEADALLAALKPPKRLVVDRGVATTTGISASMPMALTLIQAIAGREQAEAVARDIGVTHWDARRDSKAFQFTRPFALTAIGNTIALWNREQLGIELTSSIDEVSLALIADAWSRTYRSRAVTFSRTDGAKETRNGIRVIPDRVAGSWPAQHLLPTIGVRQPARALDETLQEITTRYGVRTMDFVARQLEYSPPSASPR